MILLDTDHLTELQFSGDRGDHLRVRLKASGQRPSTSIISFEEQLRGWLAEINRAKGVTDQVRVYDRLSQVLDYYTGWDVLPFDTLAATRFQALQKLHLRSIGTQDLKIAAIALRYDALLLSANLQHFRLVPGLRVEDWLHSGDAESGDS
jgi:tRNA(fMet)-specific endonuclease VapC